MQTRQSNMLQSLRSVEAFLAQHADALGGVVQSGTRQRLAQTIAELESLVAEQSGSHLMAQGATRRQQVLRRTLVRYHMAPIARIAKVDLPPTPELDALRMPRGKPAPEKLVAAAYGMAAAAAPYAEVFTAAGLPADFIAQLTAAADALLASLDERSKSRGTRRGATKGLKATLSAGRRIVHVLDALVRNALIGDLVRLANWDGAKRVQNLTGHPPAATALPPAPAATPAPALAAASLAP